jgi:hypothetical protein
MNESGVAAFEIRPEQAILELKPDGAGGFTIDFGNEELPRRNLVV